MGTIPSAINYRVEEPKSKCVQINYAEDVDG